MAERIGILTGGGDCPGLNAVIRAVVRRGINQHNLGGVFGFQEGWRGVLEGAPQTLTLDSTRGILHRGGTILGTSRTDPIKVEGGPQRIRQVLEDFDIDGLIVVGGEGTLSAATALSVKHGIPIIGVPKTIDNDIEGTSFCIGFSTALDIATEAVDRLHSTAESHHRVMLLEVMGRHAGWIATYSGMAGGADAILIPERPFNIDRVARHLRRRHGTSRTFSIVVVAEGAVPEEGTLQIPDYDRDEYGRPRLGGLASFLGPVIEERTGIPTRVTILGHVQRGGTPNAFDRVLGTSMGVAAIDMAVKHDWGLMVGMRGTSVRPVPLEQATEKLKTVPPEVYDIAQTFFG